MSLVFAAGKSNCAIAFHTMTPRPLVRPTARLFDRQKTFNFANVRG
jgi:hypothetical protein